MLLVIVALWGLAFWFGRKLGRSYQYTDPVPIAINGFLATIFTFVALILTIFSIVRL